MASQDASAIALQFSAAMTAVRRAGIAPVVGLLTADQVADLNDITTAANLVQQGLAEAAGSTEEVQSFALMVGGGVGGGSTIPSGAQTPASTVGVAPPDLAHSSAPTTPKKAPPPVPEEDETTPRRPIMKAPPQVPATTWRVTPLDQLPRKAAPTSTATSGTSTPAHVQVKPIPQRRLPTSPRASATPSTPAAPMAPMPSAPPTPAPATGGGETPTDFFVTPASKARAAALLAAGADPFDATLAMSASASGLATPAQSTTGRRPPNPQEIRAALNVQSAAMSTVAPSAAPTRPTSPKAQGKAPPEALMPPTTLMAPEPTATSADHQHIDPGLGIPAVATVVADTFLDTPLEPTEPTASAQDFLGPAPPPRPFFNLSASTTRSPTPPSPRATPSTAASASEFLGAASAGVPRPMTTVPEEERPGHASSPRRSGDRSSPRSRRRAQRAGVPGHRARRVDAARWDPRQASGRNGAATLGRKTSGASTAHMTADVGVVPSPGRRTRLIFRRSTTPTRCPWSDGELRRSTRLSPAPSAIWPVRRPGGGETEGAGGADARDGAAGGTDRDRLLLHPTLAPRRRRRPHPSAAFQGAAAACGVVRPPVPAAPRRELSLRRGGQVPQAHHDRRLRRAWEKRAPLRPL